MAEKNHDQEIKTKKTPASSDDVIGVDEFMDEVAEYLGETANGETLSADETDGSIEFFPTTKSDEEIRGKD